MATIVIPVAAVIAGVIAGFITHIWPVGAVHLSPYHAVLPLPIIVAGVIGAIISRWFYPVPGTPKLSIPWSGEPLHGPSAAWGAVVSAVLQFVVQVVWPLLQSIFFPPTPIVTVH